MKIYWVLAVIVSLVSSFAFDFPEEQNPGCKSSQNCLPASECPAVVNDFKERKIQPTICNYRPGSVKICCDKTNSPIINVGCGISSKRNNSQSTGEDVVENPYPWMAALGSSDPDTGLVTWFCGGSYIGGNLVLTAAHCVPAPGLSLLSLDLVRLGAHNLALETEANADDYRVKNVIKHPDYEYTGKILLNDIAILVLDAPEKPEVTPICLPAPDEDILRNHHPCPRCPAGTEFIVAGYGARSSSKFGVTADRVHEVRVDVEADAEHCRQVYREALGVELPDTILCDAWDYRGACQGDTGGGLLHRVKSGDQGAWTQVGLVTADIGCREGLPGLYTRLSSYLDWIKGVRRQQEQLPKL